MSFLHRIKEILHKEKKTLDRKLTEDGNKNIDAKQTLVISNDDKIANENGTVQYEIVEKEILPKNIICPDCGGVTLEGLEYCDKCGGELSNN